MAIAITIKPQHLFNILKGKKIGEVRKNKALINAIKKEIAEKGKATIYAICSKSKPYIKECGNFKVLSNTEIANTGYYLNGKVACKFECKKVEELYTDEDAWSYYTDTIVEDYEVSKLACVDDVDIEEYLNGNIGYFIHISNLTIFDKEKEIWQLRKKGYNGCYTNHKKIKCDKCNIKYPCGLDKAPQNFCYVEDTL